MDFNIYLGRVIGLVTVKVALLALIHVLSKAKLLPTFNIISWLAQHGVTVFCLLLLVGIFAYVIIPLAKAQQEKAEKDARWQVTKKEMGYIVRKRKNN